MGEMRANDPARRRKATIIRRLALGLVLAAVMPLSSLAQDDSGAQSRPQLPPEWAEKVAQGDFAVRLAITDPANLERLHLAIPLAEAVLALRRTYQGESWWETTDSRLRLETVLQIEGMTSEERSGLSEASGLWQAAVESHRNGNYDEAARFAERVVEIRTRLLGRGEIDTLTSASNLALMYELTGRYKEAESLQVKTLELRRHILGPEHPHTINNSDRLAILYQSMGRYKEAELLMMEGLEISRRVLGSDDPTAVSSLNSLALLYKSLGRYEDATLRYAEALEISRRVQGPEHPNTLTVANNLALLYESMGRYEEAEPILLETLEISRRALGLRHPDTLSSLSSLAVLYAAMGRYEEAESLQAEAFEVRRQVLGPEHPNTLISANNLARLYAEMGRYEEAEPLQVEALDISRKVLGPEHPDALTSLNNLASLYLSLGRYGEAGALFFEEIEASWRNWQLNVSTMSAAQKKQFLSASWTGADVELWSLAFEKSLAREEGLAAALLMKQLVLEAERQENGALQAATASASPKWLAAWEDREQLRRRYANLAHQSFFESDNVQPIGEQRVDPGQIRELTQQLEQLEQQLRRDNPAYATEARLQEVGLEDVRAVLRSGEALVEYVRYLHRDFESRTWGTSRYGAFVLRGNGEVAAIDLGDADTIDAAIREWRGLVNESIGRFKLLEPSRGQIQRLESQVGRSSSSLREIVWAPLEEALSRAERVYVSPDGLLSLVAFEALAKPAAEGGWRYLAEDRELIYLYAGRELGRLALRPQPENLPRDAVLVSNPAFDAAPQTLAAAFQGPTEDLLARASDEDRTTTLGASINSGDSRVSVPRNWPQVPALDRMATSTTELLERIGWSVTTLNNTGATEEAVLGLQSPRVLQFGTHGHALDAPPDETEYVNPLLRSTLLLAGVNNWSPATATFYRVEGKLLGQDEARAKGMSAEEMRATEVELADGILTAYEVTGMDLRSTELVNLTACETGLGAVSADGVASMRQAFLLAGARSLTASMWEVPVKETTDQTADFYERWLGASEPTTRYQAFRDAQLAALERARNEHGSGHPFYWAGVVYVGDPGDLPELEMTADTERNR